MRFVEFSPGLRCATIKIVAAVGLLAASAQGQTVLLDFGNSNSFRGASQVGADANGNFWTSVYSGAYYSGVADVTGTNTSIGFGFSTAGDTDSFNGPAGATTNPITQQQLDNVQIDSSALGLLGGSDAAAIDYYADSTFVLQGLNSSLTYDLTFFGSHKFNANNVTRYSTYTDNTFSNSVSSTTLTVGVGSAQNQSNVATLTGLAAQTNNTLYVGFAGDGGTGSGYLNALSLYGYLGFRNGGTNTLNSGSTYVAIGDYANGDSRSADTVIGEDTTVEVNSASGIYYNSTLVLTNAGGTIGRGTNFTVYALTGAGNLALTGTNGLTISKGGDYSGTLSMTGGTLTLNANGGLGTGDLELNGGSLVVNAAQGLGTGTITVASGTTTLNNSSALTALTGNNNFVLSGNSATFQVWGNGQVLDLGTGSVSVTGYNSLNAFSGGLQFNGTVSGSGTLNWYGSGSLVLGGSNSFSGTINAGANGGSLVLSNVNALPGATLNKGTNHNVVFGLAGSNTYRLGGLTGTGNIVLSNGNRLDVGSSDLSTTFDGLIEGTGGLSKSGTGTLLLTAASTYEGDTRINAGVLAVATNGRLGSDPDAFLASGATLDVRADTTVASVQESGTGDGGTINLGSGATLTVNGADKGTIFQNTITGQGGLTLAASGNTTLTLYGDNTFTGALAVTGGTLAASGAESNQALRSVAGVAVSSGATLLLGAGDQVNDAAAITLSGGTIERTSGVSEVFGDLNLTGNSTLDFGSGTAGHLTFGTYEADAAPTASLTVANFSSGNTLVFGSDLSAYLAPGTYQTNSFSNSYFTIGSISGGFTASSVGSTFTITAIPEPSAVLAMTGLLALFAAPACRHLLRSR